MPRKKKGSSTPAVNTHEIPDDLSLTSLYQMIMNLNAQQKTFYDSITSIVKGIFNDFKDITTEQSDNWSTYMDKTWENISSGLEAFCGKLENLEKKVKTMNSDDSCDKKLIAKGVPDNVDDESLEQYVRTVFTSLDEEIENFKTERIIVNNKPGPVCISFKEVEDITRILRKKRCLKESEEFRTIFISPWLSKQHRRTDYNIRQLVKVNHSIRYVGGRVVVKKQPNS